MIDKILEMFSLVANGSHGSVWTVLFIGFCFGAIILYSRLDKFEKMAGFMIFEDTLVPRMAMTTVALSGIGFYFLVDGGYATYDIKPTILTGLIIGAIIFGAGLVILGKCPSAFFVSVSEGRVDALVGVIGGMFGGAIFTILYPYLEPLMRPNLGKIGLSDILGGYELTIVLVLSTVLLITAYLLPTLEYVDSADDKEKRLKSSK